MKPAAPVARRADYEIAQVPHARARDFIAQHHYARGAANTSQLSLGLLRGGDLVAACLWMPPLRPCARRVHPEAPDRVIVLSRLAVAPGEPQNAATILLGAALRWLRRAGRWDVAVTFADRSQGHSGTIYRASNWEHAGTTTADALWFDAEGRQVSRKAGRSRTAAEMRALGYTRGPRAQKERFIYWLRRPTPIST